MTHPDEVMKLICALAKEHGYGVTSLDMHGHGSDTGANPRHSYSIDYVEVQNMSGERKFFSFGKSVTNNAGKNAPL